MGRTNTRRRKEWLRFWEENRRLFPFVGAFLFGIGLGVALFAVTGDSQKETYASVLPFVPVDGGFLAFFRAWGEALYPLLFFLGWLFVSGLWVCGTPFIAGGMVLQGVALGLQEAFYYARGLAGIGQVALFSVPRGLLWGAVCSMAGAESMRFSLSLGKQLRRNEPFSLHQPFRLYCRRFCVFLLLALLVGGADVLWRRIWSAVLIG